MDELFRDLLYGSLHEAGAPGPRNTGFAKGVLDQCALVGFSLATVHQRFRQIRLKTLLELYQL